MTMDLFNQFSLTTFLGVPILILALTISWMLYPRLTTQWLNNRALAIQSWFFMAFSKQIFQPLNTKARGWMMMLTTLMVFVMTLNMLGLLPYTFTPTTQLSLNMALAMPLWLATVILGFRNSTTQALGHLLPEGTPTLLTPVLIIIETVSLFIRPLALGIRLTANLTAGHLLMHLVSTAIFFLTSFSLMFTLLTSTLFFLLTVLEIAVAMIQAYVFVLLLSLYLQENV